jgi:predicted dehydrogenase
LINPFSFNARNEENSIMEKNRKGAQEQIQGSAMSRRSFLELSGSTALLTAAGLLTQVGRAWPAGTGRTIRMGVVGGRFGATFHWHEHPNCVVTGVTDLRADRREILRQHYKCDSVYNSLEEMVKKAGNIDAVAIFSGAPDHVKHTKMCMERGWHVVSACPACFTIKEAEILKEVKERTGFKYMMAESSYYRQDCIYARNLYREGGFGELFYSEVEYYHDLADLEKDKKSMFYRPDGSRSWRWGYPPMHYPTHSLGFLVGVTKERISKVSCLGWGGGEYAWLKDNVYENPFWNEASMMLTNKGHMCRCNQFWLCAAEGERAQWFGDKATLYMANYGVYNAPVKKIRLKGRTPHVPLEIPQYWKSDMLPEPMRHSSGHGGSAVFISAEFVNALLEDREPEIDLYESLAMTVPGIVGHQSALKDGEQLSVPQFERPKT